MPKNVFCESLFIRKCTLKNKYMATIFVNTYATKYGYIDKKFMEKICQVFEIKR